MYGIYTYIWLIFIVNVGIYHTWMLWDITPKNQEYALNSRNHGSVESNSLLNKIMTSLVNEPISNFHDYGRKTTHLFLSS